YQLWQARAAGADAVLLIVAVLCDQDLQDLHSLAAQLGMRALVEVHTLEEIDRALALPGIALLGINNRDLEDFSVSVKNTQTLIEAKYEQIAQKGITVVSESGIYSTEDLEFVGSLGVGAVLVGESLVRQVDIASATQRLLERKEKKQ
ncbi:MAG: indole-3-glycerol-phosphate synthase TrpC, partial [Cyanobacteria bacterium J06631_9]